MNQTTASGQKNHLLQWLKVDVLGFFVDHWPAAVFSAALSILLEHWGFLYLFTKMSWLVLFGTTAAVPQQQMAFTAAMPAVVLIQEADFVDRYAEKTPMDRCEMAKDVSRILAKSPLRLAIDFDLSPITAARGLDQSCQTQLDQMLDQAHERVILLTPFPSSNRSLQALKHAWMLARCDAGLAFADGTLHASMGVVTEHEIGEQPALQARVAEQLRKGPSDTICQQVRQAGQASNNAWVTGQASDLADAQETVPLNFKGAQTRLAVIPISSQAFEDLPSLEGSSVVLGGDWGRDDSFLTSVGVQSGAVVHGVRLDNLNHPVHPPPPWLAVCLDICIAMGFACLVNFFWSTYVEWRKLDHHLHASGHRVALGSLILTLFVVAYFGLTLFFIFAAHYMLDTFHLVIAPVLIALSMLLDGFVSGPVEKINELLEHANNTPGGTRVLNQEDPISLETWRVIQSIRGMLLLTGIATLAILFLDDSVLHQISGLVFLTLMAYFGLILAVQTLVQMTRLSRERLGLHSMYQGIVRAGHSCVRGIAEVPSGLLAFIQILATQDIHASGKKKKDLIAMGKLFAWIKAFVFWAVLVMAFYMQTHAH
jgi:hypothetical protein